MLKPNRRQQGRPIHTPILEKFVGSERNMTEQQPCFPIQPEIQNILQAIDIK